MSAVGVARAAAPFKLGFDILQPCTPEMLSDAIGHGMIWVGRYLNNLSPAERDLIFSAGLGILPYTEAMTREPLSASTGTTYGYTMAGAALDLDMPAGVHIAIDLELPDARSNAAAHVNAMASELLAHGYGAALYVGVPQPLTSRELYALRPNRYIKGGGRITDVFGSLAEPTCGWAALQLEPLESLTLGGVAVDVEVTKLDYQGRALTLWWPN